MLRNLLTTQIIDPFRFFFFLPVFFIQTKKMNKIVYIKVTNAIFLGFPEESLVRIETIRYIKKLKKINYCNIGKEIILCFHGYI